MRFKWCLKFLSQNLILPKRGNSIDKVTQSPKTRPPYVYQIPLTFVPGLGGKTIDKLLNTFGTEMNILHKLSKDDIEAIAGEKVASSIIASIEGNVKITAGGGGLYCKIETN